VIKRIFDVLVSILALVLASPIIVIASIWILADSPGPILFRQMRVGKDGLEFEILKFRTMRSNAEQSGPQITVADDSRVTRSGKILRDLKIDELPQFINVLRGEMSVVGPRPEVPRYVAYYPQEIRELVLSVRPGITDRASIIFRDESALLDSSEDPHERYVDEILPSKIAHYVEYSRTHTFFGDLRIIGGTILAILGKGRRS